MNNALKNLNKLIGIYAGISLLAIFILPKIGEHATDAF